MSFIHPSIGKVAGKEAGESTQFLGIKYGSLKDRFSEAKPIEYDGSGLNATKYGPQVETRPNGVNIELGFIQKTLPTPDFPGLSDIEGLNLNITVPAKAQAISGDERFPVLVFLHGGGYSIGGNWWPQYDGAAIVKLSRDIGKPIISININYRLGIAGFLTNPELRAAGYKPNNGLRDQRLALSWIARHIKGFGGDPENITVAGESAGGVSTGYLLCSDNPIAKRLICLGGAPPLLGQLSIEIADSVAQSVHKCLGVDSAKPSEIVSDLLKISPDEIVELLPPGLPLIPVIDGDVIPTDIKLSTLITQDPNVFPGSRKIESILLGDSKLDASILAYSGLFQRKKDIAAAFRVSAAKTLEQHPAALETLLTHYSLDDVSTTDLDDDAALKRILQLINDIAFSLPVVEIAANFPKDSYVLAFNEPNPWDGPFKGEASHILDVAFLFQNFNEHLSATQAQGALALGTDIITYVNGDVPWPAFNKTRHGMAVYENGARKYVEPPNPKDIGRHPFLFEFTAIEGNPSQDDLFQIVSNFMAAR